jgi:hypothetical protein
MIGSRPMTRKPAARSPRLSAARTGTPAESIAAAGAAVSAVIEPRTLTDRIEPGTFKRFLYWYVVILCTCYVVLDAISFVHTHYIIVSMCTCIADPDTTVLDLILSNVLNWGRFVGLAFSAGCSIIIAGFIAKRDRLGVPLTVYGYLLGTLLAIPLLIPLGIASSFDTSAGRFIAIAMFAAYGIACGAAVVIGRRRSRRRRQQRALVDAF